MPCQPLGSTPTSTTTREQFSGALQHSLGAEPCNCHLASLGSTWHAVVADRVVCPLAAVALAARARQQSCRLGLVCSTVCCTLEGRPVVALWSRGRSGQVPDS